MEAGASASARRVSALVRQLLPEIEKALEDGATMAELLTALENVGIPIKETTFRGSLYRARKQEKKNGSRKGGYLTRGQPPMVQRATPTATPAAGTGPAPKRGPLELAPRPKTFHWDPLERPVVEFIDREEEQNEKKI